MIDYARQVFQGASPEAAAALAMSPYKPPAPSPQGGVGGIVPAQYRGAQRPAAVQGMVNAAAPTVASMVEYLPLQSAPKMAQAIRGQMTPPKVGEQVKPETVIDRIREVESSGNYQAKNQYSSASGAYQYIDGNWNNYGGYPTARVAPRAIQDRRMQEDLARRVMKFDGDVFKVIAAHYLPRDADDPSTWTRPARVGKQAISPVADYVRKVVKGTALEGQFDEYLKQYAQ